MEQTIPVNVEDIAQIKRDVELLKNVLLSEGELSDWAKEALAEARAENEDSFTLDAEMELWNKASDEDLLNFEKNI